MRFSAQQGHGTVTWVISTKRGLVPGTTQCTANGSGSHVSQSSLTVLQQPSSPWALLPYPRVWDWLSQSQVDGQGSEKEISELPHARRKVTHSMEKRLRGSLTRPQEDRYLGQLTGPWCSPSLLGLINSYCQSHRFDWTQSTDSC